ncbi:hypothetical protein BRADI_1g31411v3 [Brachypodium distachyon]|uniref:F-box domain-containing protein n=1 Tax=Brachypodium distachyon TaxID=15368 RepID=A0A0Q3JY04_BRADI|nr:hypothetical protein BRADI_1g31411v3 [Brachypodium distachyon]
MGRPSKQLRTVPAPPPGGSSSITSGRLSALSHVLQEEIFLRLATPTDLVRASAACVSFRRLIADRSFLRRFRRCNSPPLLGFMDRSRPPHSSAPIARAADFSFSFLPATLGGWTVRGIRDGRVLLDRGPNVFPEIAVCDTLHRQYRLLPPIPDDLAASVRYTLEVGFKRFSEVILVPPAPGSSEDEDTSFRVVWMAQCSTEAVAFMYSSTTGQWQQVCLRMLVLADEWGGVMVYGPREEAMLVLDTTTMEFALADYPPAGRAWRGQKIGIVEAGEGRLGLLAISIGGRPQVLHYYSVFRGNRGETSSNEWRIEKVFPLDVAGYWHSIECSTERYLLLRRNAFMMCAWDFECFSLDVKTFQLERLGKSGVTCGPIYANFPPSLSSRTV